MDDDTLTPDKIDQYIAEDQAVQQDNIRQSVLSVADTNPDEFAEATKLGRQFNVPPDIVASDIKRYRNDTKLSDDLNSTMVQKYPDYAAWLQNPDNAKLTHDDIPSLTAALDAVRGVGAATTQIAADVIGQTGKGLRDFAEFGVDRAVQQGGWREVVAPYVFGSISAAGDVLEFSGDAWDKTAEAIRPENPGFVAQVAEGLGQFITQAYLVSRGQIGAAAAIGAAQGAAQQRDTLEAADNDMTAGERLLRVGAGSAVTGALELVPVAQVLGKVKIFDGVIDALPTALKNKYVNKFIQIGGAGATEAVQETAENLIHDAISVASGDQNVQFFKEWKQVAGVSGTVGALAQALVMAVTGTRNAGRASMNVDASRRQAEAVASAKEAINAAKLQSRDPEKMAEVLKAGVKEGENIRLDGNVVEQFFQSEDDIEAFYEAVPSAREQFEQARQAGTDIEIPLDEFLHAVASSKDSKFDYMADFIKIDPDVDPELQGFDMKDPEQVNAFIQQAVMTARADYEGRFDQVQEAELGERIERQIRDNLMNPELMGEKVRTPEVAATEATLYGSFARTLLKNGGEAATRVFENRFGANFQVEGFQPRMAPKARTGNADYDRLRTKVKSRRKAQEARAKKQSVNKNLFGMGRKKREAGTPKPVMNYLIESRGGILRGSTLAGELESRGVTAKRFPRLFTTKENAYTDGDTIVVKELNDAVGQDHFTDSEGGYGLNYNNEQYAGAGRVTPDQLIDAIADEANGNWIRSEEELRDEAMEESDQAVLDALQDAGIDIVDDKPTAAQIEKAMQDYATKLRLEYEDAGGAFYYQSEAGDTSGASFKKWFGDSKVVDEDGKPLVVYHGTAYDVDSFDPKKLGINTDAKSAKLGFFFTDNPIIASQYAELAGEGNDLWREVERLERDGKFDEAESLTERLEAGDTGLAENVMPVYVSIKNPMVIDFQGRKYDASRDNLSAEISKAKANGHDGIIFKNLDDSVYRNSAAAADHFVAFKPEQIKSIFNRGTFDANDPRILYQGEDKKFGSYSRMDNGKRVVRLFEKANPSTFLHETGHVFLDLFAEIAEQPDAPQQIKDDFAKALEWMGVASSSDIKTDQHEQFARGFEAYLYQGDAPSPALRSVFDSFKLWLTNVYRSIKALRVNVSPEMKDVFDRMLATNDEIEAVRSNPTVAPDTATLEMLSDSQKEEYLKRKDKAVREAKEKLFRKAYRQKKRQATDWWKAEADRVQAEVEKELQSRPVYRAIKFLQDGADFNESIVANGNHKLNESQVKEIFDAAEPSQPVGKYEVKYLPRGVRAKDGTLDVNMVADMFGFGSGLEMLNAMKDVESLPYNRAIHSMTEDRMIAKYGDMLNDGTIEREALAMVLEEDTKAAQIELKALAERTGAEYPSDGDFKKAAAIAIGQLRMDEAVKPEKYQRAALKAVREYDKALRAKDFEAAAAAKRKEILNKHLHRLARDARVEQEKALRKFKELERPPAKGSAKNVKIDPDYHQKIWDVLAKYNLNPRISLMKETRLQMQAMNEWIQAKERDEDAAILMPPELLAAEGKTHYRDLTLNEFRALRDLVTNLETQGRAKRKFILAGQARELEQLIEELVDTAEANNGTIPAPLNSRADDRKTSKKFSNIVNGLDAINTKTQQLMVQLDGGDNLGVWTKTIYAPVQAAEIQRNKRMRDEYLRYNEILNRHFGNEKAGFLSRVIVPGMAKNSDITHETMLSIALHYTGTENTRTKLIAGYKKTRGWDADYIESVLSNMTERDWNFVMDTRAYLDSFWSETSAVEARRFGYAPEKQDALPDMQFRTADGKDVTVKGGYMRIKYDSVQDARAAMNEVADSFKDMQIGRNNRAATKRGSMIEQVDGVQRPVRMDFGVLTEHVAEQVGIITMAETIENVNKVLRNPDIQQAVQNALGEDKRQMLELWLKDAAVGSQVSAGKVNWLKTVRGNYTVGRLGLKPLTAALQLSGLAHVAADADIGFKGLARGLAKLNSTGNPLEISRWIQEKSQFMQERRFTLNRDFADALGAYTSKAGYLQQKFAALMLYPMQKVQGLTDNITWLAAYDTAHRKGLNEDDAVRSADLAVARLQASGLASDLAAIERGTVGTTVQNNEFVKASTMFFSYFNAKYNLVKNAQIKFNNKEINGVELATSYLMAIVVEGMLSASIMGQLDWDDDDDDELSGMEIFKGVVGVGLAQGAATIPFVRTIAGGVEGFGGETAAMGQLAGLGEFIGRLGGTAEKLVTGDTEKINAYSLTRQGVDALNVFMPLPASVINQFIRGMEKDNKSDDAELLDYVVYRK